MSDKKCNICKKETWRLSVFKRDGTSRWICDVCVQDMIDTFRVVFGVQLLRVSGHSGLLIDLEDVYMMTDIVPPEVAARASENPTEECQKSSQPKL